MTSEELIKWYNQHVHLPISCMVLCGDGEKEYWDLEHKAIDIAAVYNVRHINSLIMPIHINEYEGVATLEASGVRIVPAIPREHLVQVDYWCDFSEG